MSAPVGVLIAIALACVQTPIEEAKHSGWADRQCLATAIYYEARGESVRGQRAVLDTIANRMLATGQGACSVIMQRGQFSWAKKKDMREYGESEREMLADVVRQPLVLGNINHKYFYSGEKPYWAYSMICRKIDRQTFCKKETT